MVSQTLLLTKWQRTYIVARTDGCDHHVLRFIFCAPPGLPIRYTCTVAKPAGAYAWHIEMMG